MLVHVGCTGNYMQMHISVSRYINREVGTFIGTRVYILDVNMHTYSGIHVNKIRIKHVCI